MRVILDTNIFISSYIFGGQVEIIFEYLLEGKFEIVSCKELEDEILDKLVNKFNISQPKFELVIKTLALAQNYQLGEIGKYTRDPKDDFLVQLAIDSKADFIVHGDKVVLVLNKIGNTQTITPSKFIELLKN
jgi:uncharacterized protein